MIGTKLYCHTPVFMKATKIKVTTIGKYYTIISGRFKVKNQICIIDDENQEHYFNINDINQYFYLPKDMRKQKLKKLNEKICTKK